MDGSELVKEYFSQNLVQYRWLDDTRTKYVDRFFILSLAILGARLQFASELTENLPWLWVMYVGFCAVASCYARAIVFFRRQQRGHGHYITALVDVVMADLQRESKMAPAGNQLRQFQQYRIGIPVFLTKWVEFSVALTATAAPTIAAADFWVVCFHAEWTNLWIILLGTGLSALVADATLRPWSAFNSKDPLDYSNKYDVFPVMLWHKVLKPKEQP